MNARRPVARRRVLRPTLLAAVLAAATAMQAQAQQGAPDRVAALSPSAAPMPTDRPYEDRVLETGPQQPDSAESEAGYNPEGWARSLRFEYSMAATRGPSRSLARAIGVSGYLETPQYGTLSLQGTLVDSRTDTPLFGSSASQSSQAGTWRVDQRALPLPGGWLGNHGAGTINTLVPGLGRGLSRVYLPSTPITGLGGEWLAGERIALNASAGQPGLYAGIDSKGFQSSRGQLATAGGQLRLVGAPGGTSHTDAALQVVQARDAQSFASAAGAPVTSAWGALSWEGAVPWGTGLRQPRPAEAASTQPGGARLQWSFLQSSGAGAAGSWLDGSWRTELVQHTAGVFHLEPGLRWGATTMPADLRGGYWRGDVATRRWQAGWSSELSESISGQFGSSAFGTVYGRYLLDTRNSVDATLALRTGSGEAQSVQANWDHASDWGQTRWRASLLRAAAGRTAFLGVDHAWLLSAPNVLSTSAGWQASNASATASPIWTWAVLGATSPIARLTLDASLRGARGGPASALFANIGASWQLAPEWAVAARYTEARGQDPQTAQVVSALTAASEAAALVNVASRSLQVTLRYETRAGTLPVPLGGSRTSGAGGLSGTVYFDANHNGRREASETGAPNVTVVLDGRFVARTDAAGRYEFPSVVAGPHAVQVQPDNVPLPWSPLSQEPVRTTVLVRGQTVEDFALQRER